ncbi:MAG: cysteine desulfurase family protein [Deltaproteobacteria bacterium]|nr:cysteine desulfurase family protein [Deltaproteobacteria bacterium]
MSGGRIYLDHNATTPVRPEVVRVMTAALCQCWGNPSSTHAEGAAARRALDCAREQVAALTGALPGQVIFTAGATEANNAVLHGVRALCGGGRPHFAATTIEHPSVLEPLRAFESGGARITWLGVDCDGRVNLAEAAAACAAEPALLSVILANNETGVVQDLPAIAGLAQARGVPLHVDATQAAGKIALDAARCADWLTGSAHKLGGPKGAGFLVARSALALPPLLRGGPQEKRRRGGTENLPGIIGLGAACELARADSARGARTAALRDRLWEGMAKSIPRVRRNGSAQHALPNTLSVEFEQVAGEVLLEALDGEGVAASSGAACASGSIEPSHVLLAMGRTPQQARASLRFSLGPANTGEEIARVLELLPPLVARVREAAP